MPRTEPRARPGAAARKPPASHKRGRYAKSDETRERILAAAFAVASEVGIHRTSVARIAERAGVATGNLHYHFGSLEVLLRELMEWVLDTLLGQLRDAGAERGDFFAREEASLRAYLAFVQRNPAYVRLAEEVRLHHPDLYRRGMQRWLGLLRDALEQGVRRGELRPLDAGELAAQTHLLLGARYFLDQMIEGVDGRPYPGDDAVVAAYLKLVRNGLSKEAS